MKLRTGKTFGEVRKQNNLPKMYDRFIYIEQQHLYINEIRAMMDQLEEWSSCPSARMAGLVDVYEYIDNHCEKFHDLTTFHTGVGKGARNILKDLSRLSPTADKETLHHMKLLAPILISVLAKLG